MRVCWTDMYTSQITFQSPYHTLASPVPHAYCSEIRGFPVIGPLQSKVFKCQWRQCRDSDTDRISVTASALPCWHHQHHAHSASNFQQAIDRITVTTTHCWLSAFVHLHAGCILIQPLVLAFETICITVGLLCTNRRLCTPRWTVEFGPFQ